MVSEYIILLPYFNNMYNFCWSIALQNNCYVYMTAKCVYDRLMYMWQATVYVTT